ncbi:NUDIX hydrolase [Amycolatopsis magusensis]|uniref:NUDIX hydrolase n=1 Tax=Amycolatopsis magusensis TaxID=882444 RepID=UPI003C2F16AF
MPDGQHTIIDAHVLLIRDSQVLLTRRRGTYGDGMWHLPSGKLDPGESLPNAAIREAHEEIGVHINPDDLHHVHTLHVTGAGQTPRLGIFFATHHWTGQPRNREPDKCSAIAWFPLDALPSNVIPYPLAGIHAYLSEQPFGLLGWPQPTHLATT